MRLYADQSIKANAVDSRVRGQYGQGPDAGWRSVDAEVRRRNPSAPQGDLFLESQAQERQSLDHQDIPLDYKDAVRRYFDALEDRP
jgi:hypothetical protein